MLDELGRLLALWRPHFARRAGLARLCAVLIGLLVAPDRRRTLTASITQRGRQNLAHAADYFIFSRADWEPRDLFGSVVDATVDTLDRLQIGRRLVVAMDDTGVKKTGKTIAAAGWQRDPLSPHFHVNLRWGLRFLHLAAIVPGHELGYGAQAVSIAYTLAPALKKPRKSAPPEVHAEFKTAKRKQNLSTRAVDEMTHLRAHLDKGGREDLAVLMVTDASYLNTTVLRGLPERVDLVSRTRSSAKLYRPAPAGGRKKYGDALQTPDEVRRDDEKPWEHARIHYAGALRPVRYKEVPEVMWKPAGAKRRLRLLVIAPTPYRAPGTKNRKYYRDPSYLLTTDLTAPSVELIQMYFDRWQIEVEHRNQKHVLGVGEAQVHADKSVPRMHSAHVALWSMCKLAAMRSEGLGRTWAYPPRPRWYKQEKNEEPSAGDIVDLLRMELHRARRKAGLDVFRGTVDRNFTKSLTFDQQGALAA